jgi:precorrin-2 dehydrogenase / sirohydrochlorin ferrochelatase
MRYLPISVDVSGRDCVVIGGGDIAERKVRSLIEAGAAVVVISPRVTSELAAMVRAETIRHFRRAYRYGDLAGAFIAFEATGDIATAHAATAEARARGVPINVADVPELCTFIAPAVVHRGSLQIAVSTGGACPALARKIREELEERFGLEYELTIDFLAAARQWLRSHQPDGGTRAHLLGVLVNSELHECLKRGDLAAADAIALRVLGASLVDIGFEMPRMPAAVSHPAGGPNGRSNESR